MQSNKLYIHIFIISFNLSLSLLFSPGCSDDKIINEDKLVLIYSDLLIAQDTTSLNAQGLDSLRQSIFKKYNVTEKDYEGTIEYYNEELKRWEEFFDKVSAHIESLSQTSSKKRIF